MFNMSKKQQADKPRESGAHGGNKPGRESGAHADKQKRVGRELPAKHEGRHEVRGGKTNHQRTTLRAIGDINEKPGATPALSKKEVSNLQV
jgi:hypothetical protein